MNYRRRVLIVCRALAIALVASFLAPAVSGCRNASSTEPDAKVRLKKLLALYLAYVDKNKKGPADENALRNFGKSLTAQERDALMIGDDLDTIFISPRDNQKFVVIYKLNLDAGAEMQAVAWEAAATGGMRFVALSNGYVEEYDDETFQQYKK